MKAIPHPRAASVPLNALHDFPKGTRLTDAQAWLLRRGFRLALGRDGLRAMAQAKA